MRLGLQPDSDVFDGRGQDCVGQTSEGAGSVVLAIREWFGFVLDLVNGLTLLCRILGFKGPSRVMKASELDRNAGADPYEWRESSFVEGGCALVFQDLAGGV